MIVIGINVKNYNLDHNTICVRKSYFLLIVFQIAIGFTTEKYIGVQMNKVLFRKTFIILIISLYRIIQFCLFRHTKFRSINLIWKSDSIVNIIKKKKRLVPSEIQFSVLWVSVKCRLRPVYHMSTNKIYTIMCIKIIIFLLRKKSHPMTLKWNVFKTIANTISIILFFLYL